MSAPLFLIGFMAAGKTTVGRMHAHATGRSFLDLDDLIAQKAGEPVPALVARDQLKFRELEAFVLERLIVDGLDHHVVATGGGAAAFGDNLRRMRAAGLVVALGVDVKDAQARAAGGPERPLLADAEQLARKRAQHYRRAHAVVETSGRSLADVVAEVGAVERAWLRLPSGHRDATLLALGERSYPVVVHPRAVEGDLVRTYLEKATKVVVVSDHNVARHWKSAALAELDDVDFVTIEPGEASKNVGQFGALCETLVAKGLDRSSALVALGGGVIGDLTGFVASTLFRGIPVLQLPTTIVAMTDAAIGGKTAIDLAAGKNLVGAFWQPRLVACGLEMLSTLPARERRAGFGELWKYALLDGEHLWGLVDACAGWAASDEAAPVPPTALGEVIERSIAYKAATVGRDERELTGFRALLNLGHTVGHAIESASGMQHGEAVALGLIAACRVSASVVGARPTLEGELVAALRRTGLPAELDPYLSDDVLDRIRVDKKRIGDKLRFIAIREVGACEPVEITVTDLRRILRSVLTP
jgi:shikimate kinase/3-dehydroquinate synthase